MRNRMDSQAGIWERGNSLAAVTSVLETKQALCGQKFKKYRFFTMQG